jgi:hypothetical protein
MSSLDIDLGGEDRWAFLTWLASVLDDPDFDIEYQFVAGHEPRLPSIRDVPFREVMEAVH